MLDFTLYGLNINIRYKQLLTHIKKQIQLECGRMPNVMAALPFMERSVPITYQNNHPDLCPVPRYQHSLLIFVTFIRPPTVYLPNYTRISDPSFQYTSPCLWNQKISALFC